MIAQLQGQIVEKSLEKDSLRVVMDVHGVGYEVFLVKASDAKLRVGGTLTLYIRESVTAFDGATTLYGFVSREESELFDQIRENVEGMGPKKALECMDKITKSLPDFKRAVIDDDLPLLVSVFGFTKKTAEKLVFSLKGKIESWAVSGPVKWAETPKGPEWETLSGLVNLGYSEVEAREAVQRVKEKLGAGASMKALLQESLRLMGARLS
jgi:Holliday junction DNA helicase RuvA